MNPVLLAPLASIFIVFGIGIIGGIVLTVLVPPGSGDYGYAALQEEREARQRGWIRDMTRGYGEKTAAQLQGINTESPDYIPLKYPGRATMEEMEAEAPAAPKP